MNRIGLVLCLGCTLIFILTVSVLADVYTWKDADGKINVTQTPPPDGATIIKIIKKSTPTPEKDGDSRSETKNNQEGVISRPTSSKSREPAIMISSDSDDSDDTDVTPTETPDMGPTATPTQTPITDNEGKTEEWWRAHSSKLRNKLKQAEQKLESIKNELRILNQGHRRPDEVDNLRARQRDLEAEIADLKEQVNNLENEVRKAGGYPGWVRN